MGKKGKGNKLAKMSEEERARYLQQRADIEEETRRRKMQLISLYMKNKLKREDAFCRLNMAKINLEWRSVLRQVKVQELRNEMIELEKFCKEAVQRKDRVLQRLLSDLDIAEDMFANMQQSHMENIEKIIDLHRQRIAFFRQFYEDNKNLVLQEWQQDFADFRAARESSQGRLECVMHQLELHMENSSKDNHENYLAAVDDLKSSMQLELEQITCNGEARLEQLWQAYQDVLAGYVQHTEGFYAEYVDLKERDEESALQIRDQKFELQQVTEQLAQAKLLSADVTEQQTEKARHLQSIKDELCARLRELRKRVEQEQSGDAQVIKLMSVECYDVIEHSKQVLARGEILMQLAQVCRKHETEREQLLPLGLPPLPRELFAYGDDEPTIVPAALSEHCGIVYFPQLEKFWRRVNNVTVDVACLKQCKKRFEAENEQLKSELREHLINLNLSNGSNSHINDYLAKRPSSMRIERIQQMELVPKKVKSAGAGAGAMRLRPLRTATACIEANLSNAVRSRELTKTKSKLAKIDVRINW